MKKVLGFGILAALAVFGCQVREEGEFAPEGKVFMATTEAYFADGVETKTSMDAEGNVLWKQGDQVSIFVGRNINDQYQVADAYDGRTEAAMNLVSSPGFVAGSEIANNVAVYPYSSTTFLDTKGENAYSISGISLPERQNYAQGSFGNGAFPMVAVTSSTRDYNLKFKNVVGGLKLQLKGTAKVAYISITGNNNERLCGNAVINVSTTSVPSISMNDVSATTVTMDCGDGVLLNEATATAFIIALPPMKFNGGFTVVVTDTAGATMEIKTTKTQTITRSNLLSMPVVTYEGTAPAPEHQYVDLGLTSGLKWATCNVGASAPEGYGDYYAWGETEPYYSNQDPLTWKNGKSAGYAWASYRWCNGSYNTQTKYNCNSSYGTIDNKTVLALEDDAASVNWGGTWRMPTDAEWTELRTECIWTWTTRNGVYGRLVTGPNENSIFLPAAGFRNGTDLNDTGFGGYYWSSSLYTDDPYYAYSVCVYSDFVGRYGYNFYGRIIGYSVRPVTDEGVKISVTGISLNKSSLALDVEQTETITATVSPSNATQKNVIWLSSNTSVATVSWEGVVTAVATGNATITATTYDGGYTVTCSVTVTAPTTGTDNGHAWVDLGLTSGLKWATCNVGANGPEKYGDYFAWGETEPYYTSQNPLIWKYDKSNGYEWVSYKWCNGDYNRLTKYNYNSSYGIVDNKAILDVEDDAAHVNWGGNWRMPTDEEQTELRTECTWTWTTQNGIGGQLVTGPNGNSIFLPAAGWRYLTYLYDTGSDGYYWSSDGQMTSASGVHIKSGRVSGQNTSRCAGYSVRPVTE